MALAPVSAQQSGCEYRVRLVACFTAVCVHTGKGSPGSESDGGDSRSDLGSGEIQPKKVMILPNASQIYCSSGFSSFATFPEGPFLAHFAELVDG